MLTVCALILIGVWVLSRNLWMGARIFLMVIILFSFVYDQVITAYRYRVLSEGRCELKVYEWPKDVRGYISSSAYAVGEQYLLQHDYDWVEGGVFDDNNPVYVDFRFEKTSNGKVMVQKNVKPISRYLVGGDRRKFYVLGHDISIDRRYVKDIVSHKLIAEIDDVRTGGGRFFLGRGVYELLRSDQCWSRWRENEKIMGDLAEIVFKGGMK